MAGKLLSILTKNLPFKILAIGLAFILWLVVYNIDDPKITQTYTTNVTIENVSVITEQNKCYEVLENTNVVTFAVTGKRSVMKNLGDTDFHAVADLSRMIYNDDGVTANVPIEISSSRSNNALNFPNKKYLKLSLEELKSKRLNVIATTSGKVAEGYALGEVMDPSPNVLKVSGPASIVSSIVSAVATIDVSGMSVNLSDNVVPVLYDAEGREVDTTRLTISNTTVTVMARILLVKELPLSFSTYGTPGGACSVVGITSAPEVVQVKGAASVLNPLTGIVIPPEMLDVSGMIEDINTTIDITEFLPDGVELVDPAKARVAVNVRIEPYVTQRYAIETAQIVVEGLDNGYRLTFRNPTVFVSVSALQMNLDLLGAGNIVGRIDVAELGEGTHQVELVLDLDDEHYAYQSILVEVMIEKEQPDEPEGGAQPAGTGDTAPGDVSVPGYDGSDEE